MCLPQVIKSFQNYRGVATTFYPTLVYITINLLFYVYREKDAEEDISTEEGASDRRMDKTAS